MPLRAAEFRQAGLVGWPVVLFDLDGTLTDPFEGIANSVRYALEALSLPDLSDGELRAWVGPPLQESFASLGLSPDLVTRAIESYRGYFTDRGLYENRVYRDVEEVLAALRGHGTRLAVATSKPTVFAERIVDHFGLAAHFEHVLGSELDGRRRHKHEVISETLDRLGQPAPGTVVMIGDRAQDISAAAHLGIAAIAVAWGYAGEGELEATGATIAQTARDLLPLLLDGSGEGGDAR